MGYVLLNNCKNKQRAGGTHTHRPSPQMVTKPETKPKTEPPKPEPQKREPKQQPEPTGMHLPSMNNLCQFVQTALSFFCLYTVPMIEYI